MPRKVAHPKRFCRKNGIAQSSISRFESGNHNPSLAFLQRGRIGEESLYRVLISKSAVDFESVFEVEKRFKNLPHFLKTK